MTDTEISKALALAIGWGRGDIIEYKWKPFVQVWWQEGWETDWRTFDYRDWNVIAPIAEKYNCFPYQPWRGNWRTCGVDAFVDADTPQKAIAMAVIRAKP